jgi:RluA family pseudouridine synthase
MKTILHYDIGLGYAVLNKPSGIDTFGFVEAAAHTVLGLFRRAASTKLIDKRIDGAHAVHRLDKPTSGCLVVGLTHSARRRLSNVIQKHKVQKTYLAVVCGNLVQEQGVIDAPLSERRVPTNGNGYSVIYVDPDEGKPATTLFRVLSRDERYSLVELSPITGRTHQLRVHCAHMGCPIVGDPWYPVPQSRDKMLHLHAHKIKLPEQTFAGVEVVAQIPAHMRDTLRELPTGHLGL